MLFNGRNLIYRRHFQHWSQRGLVHQSELFLLSTSSLCWPVTRGLGLYLYKIGDQLHFWAKLEVLRIKGGVLMKKSLRSCSQQSTNVTSLTLFEKDWSWESQAPEHTPFLLMSGDAVGSSMYEGDFPIAWILRSCRRPRIWCSCEWVPGQSHD